MLPRNVWTKAWHTDLVEWKKGGYFLYATVTCIMLDVGYGQAHSLKHRRLVFDFMTVKINDSLPFRLERASVILILRSRQLLSCVSDRRLANGVVDLSTCIHHWSYDVMGDLTFGGSNRIVCHDFFAPLFSLLIHTQ